MLYNSTLFIVYVNLRSTYLELPAVLHPQTSGKMKQPTGFYNQIKKQKVVKCNQIFLLSFALILANMI